MWRHWQPARVLGFGTKRPPFNSGHPNPGHRPLAIFAGGLFSAGPIDAANRLNHATPTIPRHTTMAPWLIQVTIQSSSTRTSKKT
jgi:hypothetical protein